ncbi:hypothetical protein RI129_011696 [Pyrocoelia pectoralis]|uniref:Uncharacterized protein n=1 Tax=Pyrocoelia pectoralis TaxID=417401 RepID=A0AAN7V380_9COLE
MISTIFVFILFAQQYVAQDELDVKQSFISKRDEFPLTDYSEFPKTEGFHVHKKDYERFRRDINEKKGDEIDKQTQGERPVEVAKKLSSNESADDFIRLRRGTGRDAVERDVENIKDAINVNEYSSNEKQRRTARMLLQDDNDVPEGFREPRGAIREQWVKQPYPVIVDDTHFEDSIMENSDRVPRAHFVTQRRLEPSPAIYRMYEREGRSRDTFRDLDRDLPPSASRVPPPNYDYYPSERPSKRFESYPIRSFNPYRDDPYYRYEESRYDPRYGSLESERPRSELPTRQRRIIYYATLPEVVRTPPNVNLRNRYTYRDAYDDRYVTSPSQPVGEESSYRFRKPSTPYTKSRHEQEIERTKASYPLKVSTDVNVRETKKNPERRIYSEPDSRYAYKAQSKETFDQRT